MTNCAFIETLIISAIADSTRVCENSSCNFSGANLCRVWFMNTHEKSVQCHGDVTGQASFWMLHRRDLLNVYWHKLIGIRRRGFNDQPAVIETRELIYDRTLIMMSVAAEKFVVYAKYDIICITAATSIFGLLRESARGEPRQRTFNFGFWPSRIASFVVIGRFAGCRDSWER